MAVRESLKAAMANALGPGSGIDDRLSLGEDRYGGRLGPGVNGASPSPKPKSMADVDAEVPPRVVSLVPDVGDWVPDLMERSLRSETPLVERPSERDLDTGDFSSFITHLVLVPRERHRSF